MIWDISTNRSFQKTIRDLRMDLVDNLSRTSMSKFNSTNHGALIGRLTTDSANVVNFVDVFIGNLRDVLVAVGFIIYICFVNIWLGLLLIAMVIALSVFDNSLQRYAYKMGQKEKIIYEKNLGTVTEFVRGISDIKVLNIRKNVTKKYHDGVNNMHNILTDMEVGKQVKIRIRRSLEYVFTFIFIVLGIFLLLNGNLLIGTFIIVIFYRTYAISLIQAISNIRLSYKETLISAERICELLDDKVFEKEKFGKKTIKNPQGKIEFKDVTFCYDNEIILKDFNITINPNQCFGIVGKSGQGKSTIIKLLSKLYEVNKGEIFVDDINLKELSEDCLRNIISGVSQNPYIFNTSIKENLRFVKPDLTEQEMIEACKKVNLHSFIMSKPDAYDTIIGDNGTILSGGQKQRLAIARCLLKNSKVLLFDEATSALDNENQFEIQKTINELSKDHTVIIIAHRLSTIMNCDKIIVIDEGKVIDSGTHQTLMHSCSQYKNLYHMEENSQNERT